MVGASYSNAGKLMPYWINTSSNALIRKCVLASNEEFFEQFDQLIFIGRVKVTVNTQTSFFEISNNETLCGMLLNAGYVTVAEELDLFTGFSEVRIPNKEVQTEFQSIVAQRINLGESLHKEMFY